MSEAINQSAQAANNFGLGVFLAVAMTAFLAWVIIYVLKTNNEREERQAKANREREERLAAIIERDIANLRNSLETSNTQTLEFRSRLEESNRRLREEHERADKKLDALMEHKERIADILQTVAIQMSNLQRKTP